MLERIGCQCTRAFLLESYQPFIPSVQGMHTEIMEGGAAMELEKIFQLLLNAPRHLRHNHQSASYSALRLVDQGTENKVQTR